MRRGAGGPLRSDDKPPGPVSDSRCGAPPRTGDIGPAGAEAEDVRQQCCPAPAEKSPLCLGVSIADEAYPPAPPPHPPRRLTRSAASAAAPESDDLRDVGGLSAMHHAARSFVSAVSDSIKSSDDPIRGRPAVSRSVGTWGVQGERLSEPGGGAGGCAKA